MKNVEGGITCKNCGAPVTSEICPFCHCPTGLKTEEANMEYPVMNCKSAQISFWNFVFPLIFAVSFGFAGLSGLIITSTISNVIEDESVINFTRGFNAITFITSAPFLIISIVCFVVIFRQLYKYVIVKGRGERITATVYGYMNDTVLISGSPAQVVKLLIDTENGKRFILYRLGNIYQPYGVNTQIELIMYNNFFLINDKV